MRWKRSLVIFVCSVIAIGAVMFATSDGSDTKAETYYEDIEKFPESYKIALYTLKEKHPNWIFEAMYTGLDWNEVVYYEMTPAYRSLVPSYFDSSFVGAYYGDGWSCATQAAVEYYLDPRNWLTEDYIFQFEKLTYNGNTQGIVTVQKVLANSFMSGYIQPDPKHNGENNDKGEYQPTYEEIGLTYAQAFQDIGTLIGVSPVHLASRVTQEQGLSGTSDLISGTYPGYEGYYNYYNMQATGKEHEEIVRNGLNEAKAEVWNDRYAALLGGSTKLAQRYILRGQDTLYLQKFDVDGSYDGRYWHQYMQNLVAPSNEGRRIMKAYEKAGMMDEAFVFKIPVYNNMVSDKVITLNVKSITYNVGDAGIPTITCGGEKQENYMFSWVSDNKKVATVDQYGRIVAVGAGKCTITCSKMGYEPAEIQVKVRDNYQLNFSKVGITPGQSLAFSLYKNAELVNSKDISWVVSNTDIASVSSTGIVTAKKAGKLVLSSYIGKDKVAECEINVMKDNCVTLNVSKQTWEVGHSARFKAYIDGKAADGNKMTWSSSDKNVAVVSADGTVTAKGAGTCYIYCTIDNGTTAACTMVVTGETSKPEESGKKKVTLNVSKQTWEVGHSARFKAYVDGVYTDGSRMKWSSSNTNVAKVDNGGVVTAVGEGTCYIYCTTDNGTTASCTMIINGKATDSDESNGNPAESAKKKVTLNVSKQTWEVGHSARFKAYVDGVYTAGTNMKWSSSDANVAKVDANGVVTAVGGGNCYIYCTTDNGTTASCKMVITGEPVKPGDNAEKQVTLNVDRQKWEVGHSARFKAYVDGVYTAGTNMKWSSSDTSVASVDANGVVTAVGTGTCYIYCTMDGGTTAACTMIVN